MKRNLAKILVLAISLVLLIGAAIGIMASAEEYTYKIVSMNIAHGDTTVILVAVDAPATGEAPESVAVTYVDAAGETLTAKYYGDLNVYGTTYPVYYTKGISAKDIGQDVVATVSLDGEAKDSDNVSVAEYLYGKLYKENYINATAAKDVNRKNLYLNLLDYAASAETVLWNDKDENADNQRTLLTDKFYVYADGVAEDILAANETFTLNYAGEAPAGYTFSGYWKSTVDGTSYVTDGVATNPTVHGVYSPVFYLTEDVAGKYYNSENAGARYDFTEAFNNTVYSEENPDGDLAADFISDSTNSYGAGSATLAANEGALEFNMTTSAWVGFTLSAKGNGTGKKLVAEFDFTYNGGTAYTGNSKKDDMPFYIGLTKSNESNANYLIGGNQSAYIDNCNGLALFGVPMAKGETYNVRIVYDATGTYSAYVDDVCTYTKTFTAADASITGLGIYVRQRHAGDTFSFSMDNVYIGAFDSFYDDLTFAGTRYDFDDGVLPAGVTHNTKRGTAPKNATVVEDTVVNENDETVGTGNYRLLETSTAWWGIAIESGDNNRYSAGKYVFEGDLCVTAMVYKDKSGSLFAGLLGDYNAADDLDQTRPGTANPGAISDTYMGYTANGNTTYTWYGATLNIGQTYKVAIVYDVETGLADFYVDGVLVSDDMDAHATKVVADKSLFYGVFFYPRASGCTFTLDNVYLGVIDGVIKEAE